MFPFQVPAQVQPAPETLSLEAASARVLDRYDAQGRWTPMELPRVPPSDQARLAWLVACLQDGPPANPFRKGSPDWREAESLRALLAAPSSKRADRLAAVPLRLEGSRMATWAWGRGLARSGALEAALRRAWEDRLLEGEPPGLATSYALRHALCFALAAQDEARFADLKARFLERQPELVLDFQKLFAWIGTPGPTLRLWSLPDLAPKDLRLGDLGRAEVRIQALPEKDPLSARGAWAWIVPTPSGGLGAKEAHLDEAARKECEAIRLRLGGEASATWVAPSGEAFQEEGFSFFPIRLSLDAEGRITGIRMGPAVPSEP